MDVDVIEDSKSRLVIDLPGRGHTICNPLKDELWQDKNNVKVASYNIAHPLVGVPRLIVETSSGAPRAAISSAIKSLVKQSEEIISAAKKI